MALNLKVPHLTVAAVLAGAAPFSGAHAAPAQVVAVLQAQDLGVALRAFARLAGEQIAFDDALVRGKVSAPLNGRYTPEQGIRTLLAGSGLVVERGRTNIMIIRASAVQAEPAPASVARRGTAARSSPATAALAEPEPPQAESEILVTAQKRAERTVDVPISITAMSGERLVEAGVKRPYDIAQLVPGMRFDDDGANPQPSIRGIVSLIDGPGVSSAVAMYIDGFYQPRLQTLPFEFVGTESVQVLKGPQGTLFGRNATGGAILIATRNPSLTAPSLEAGVSYARFDDLRAQLYASHPIGDKLAINLAASYRHYEGFTRDIASGRHSGGIERYTVRAKLLYEPTDTLSMVLSLDRTKSDDRNAVAYGSYQGISNADAILGNAPGTSLVPIRRGETSTDFSNKISGWGESVRLKIKNVWPDSFSITSYTQYSRENFGLSIDIDGTALPIYGITTPEPQRTFTQEINVASESNDSFNWAAGLYYYYNKATFGPSKSGGVLVDPTGKLLLVSYDTSVRTTAYAAFADATYTVVPNLFFTLGGRYSGERQRGFAQQNPDGLPAEAFGGPSPPGQPISDVQKFHSFTPRAVIRWHFMPNANVYASFAKGFKGGGYATSDFSQAPAIPTFKPEHIVAYELGLKARLGRVKVEAAVYDMEYKNQQNIFYEAGINHIDNAPKSRIYGAEASIEVRLLPSLTVGASGAYTHARYKDFKTAALTLLDGITTVDVSGQQMLRTPTYTGNVFASYKRSVLNGELSLTTSYYRTSKFKFDPAGAYIQKGYGLWNARGGYGFDNGRYTVSVFADNITDQKYITHILPIAGINILQNWATPATYGVEFAVKL